MRIPLLVLALATLLLLAGCGSVERDGALSYTPAQPAPDGVLSIEYHPDESPSPLTDPQGVSLRFTLVSASGELHSEALPMEASGSAWRIELEPSALVDDPALLVCAFLDGEDTERVDNRQGQPWRILFHEGGEPVLGARFQEYRLLSGRERLADVLTVPRDRDAGPEALTAELEMHPENLSAQIRHWADLLAAPEDSDSLIEHVEGQLPSLIEAQRPLGGEDLAGLVDLYGQMDQVLRRDSLVAVISEEMPGSEAARLWALRRARSQADPAQRIVEMRRVLDSFAGYEDEAYDRGLTVYWALTRAAQPELAEEILDEGGALDPDIGEYCADLLRQKGDRDRALALLRRMQDVREKDEWSPDGAASREEWLRESSGMLAQNLFLQAQILITEGLSREALPLMDRIVEEMPEHADGELLRALIDTEIRMERTEGVVGHFELLLEHADPTPEEMDTWREHHGEEAHFLAYLAQLRDELRQKAHVRFERHALRWPAPAVTFSDEAGEALPLASLKGKVVLLDFWATWCGPCRMALPGVNALAHELEGEEDFFVLPANTWERSRGEARRQAVAESWETLGMDIPVYFDTEDEEGPAPAVEQFGVTGIPTQFIIGKDGSILFKMVGFHGESGERELRQKIEWALEAE